MALGLCCEWVEETNKGHKNILISRNLQLGRFLQRYYSDTQVKQCYLDNLNNLLQVLPLIRQSGIYFFRISSAMFPLFDKVNPTSYLNEEITSLLKKVGEFVTSQHMRVATHPGQFVVLSSNNPVTVKNSIREMNFHGWLFDQMGLPRSPYYAINIHGGKSDMGGNLIDVINELDDSARLRMTLENDEFSYSIANLEFISHETGVPLVFDSHHHSLFSDDLTQQEALEIALATWPSGVKPTTHLSNSKLEYHLHENISKRRIHSDYINYIPEAQLLAYQQGKIDMEIEAKAKNLAIFKFVKEFDVDL